ncbi:uncharacterized mitochondrial protein-like protein [Tanacetum coccineum]
MDVKSAFLYGKIEEEVYVCQHQDLKIQTFLIEYTRLKKHCMDYIKLLELGTKVILFLVQVYVDDIIFGSTKKELCFAFEKLMHEKFQMSSMGELTFLLGLQVKQKKYGIFISQDKYVDEILNKLRFTKFKTASTPMETQKNLLKDEDVCACARYQVNPKVSHLQAGQGYLSTLKGASLIESQQQGLSIPGCILKTWPMQETNQRDLQLEDAEGVNCLPNSTIFEQLVLMGLKTTAWNEFSSTMASVIICLATNQKFNFSKYIFESMVRNLENLSGKFLMYPRFESVSKHSNDSLLIRGNTLQSDEDRLKLKELMALCTNLHQRVLDLEKTKTTQGNKIANLKRRVKKLEKKIRSRTHKLKRLYKVGLTARVESSGDEESNKEVFAAGQNENVIKEVVNAAQVSTAATTVTITTEEITLAQALEALKTSKPK